MSHQCPVCGFSALFAPPADFEICPCCGTEFGYDDDRYSHLQLRSRWMARGAPWFSRANPSPANWSPLAQLVRAGYLELHTTVSATTHIRRKADENSFQIAVNGAPA